MTTAHNRMKSYITHKLAKYFDMITGILPSDMESIDSHRLFALYVSIGGLALLRKIKTIDSNNLIKFVYSHQVLPCIEFGSKRCGFRGSNFIGCPLNIEQALASPLPYDSSHITMTYLALCILLHLGDDLSGVDREAVTEGLIYLQSMNDDVLRAGIFCPESDARVVFSAVASAYIIGTLDRLETKRFIKFFADSMTYEGGFGQKPGLEAHAGATYCAIASLKLLNSLDTLLPVNSVSRDHLINWLVHRQKLGLNGRSGKDDDSCYTFWVGACLRILGVHWLIDQASLLEFLSRTWCPMVGGFTKTDLDTICDPTHTFLVVSGLSCLLHPLDKEVDSIESFENPKENSDSIKTGILNFSDESREVCTSILYMAHEAPSEESQSTGIDLIVPQLNITKTAYQNLQQIHKRWSVEMKK